MEGLLLVEEAADKEAPCNTVLAGVNPNMWNMRFVVISVYEVCL